MWTSGAVGMWITVAAQSPRQVPGLSLTPPGNHPAAGMRRSRRPRAARLRSAGGRNGAADGQDRTGRRQMRPIRAVRMSRGPGPTAGPGYGETPDPVTGEPHGAEAQRAAEQRAGCGPAGTGQRAQRRGPPGGRRQVLRPECRAGGGPGAEGGRIRPRGTGLGPPRPRMAGPGPRGCRTGPSQSASGVRSPDRGGRERPRPASSPRQARRG